MTITSSEKYMYVEHYHRSNINYSSLMEKISTVFECSPFGERCFWTGPISRILHLFPLITSDMLHRKPLEVFHEEIICPPFGYSQ